MRIALVARFGTRFEETRDYPTTAGIRSSIAWDLVVGMGVLRTDGTPARVNRIDFAC